MLPQSKFQNPNHHTTQKILHGTDLQTPTGHYMPVISATTTFCEVYEYPNLKVIQWAANNLKTERNQQFSYTNKKTEIPLKTKQSQSSQSSDKISDPQ